MKLARPESSDSYRKRPEASLSLLCWLSRTARVSVSLVALCGPLTSCWEPAKPIACQLSQADWNAIEAGGAHSTARVWDELGLHAIRSVLPQPTVHARNLYHLSVAMYDAWAAYDDTAQQVLSSEKQIAGRTDAARAEAVAFAAHRVLQKRYASTQGQSDVLDCLDEGLRRAGLAPDNLSSEGMTPAAIGNRIGQAVLDTTLQDGANEANGYADTTAFAPINDVLQPALPGSSLVNPDHWQPLLLEQPFTQNGIPQSGPQRFITPHWGRVRPFAMTRQGRFYHDPGPVPSAASPAMRDLWIVDVLQKQSLLDANDPTTMDVSPGALGNNTLGMNDGAGHALNPVNGVVYPAVMQRRSDYWRVVAEFWADGPTSETPPGHWNLLANTVSDAPGFQRKLEGTGAKLSPLEWDVKLYLALNGALHDAAIVAWEIKRETSTARPISLVRYFAASDPRGLPLVPGVLEVRDGRMRVRRWHAFPVAGSSVFWDDPSGWVPFQRSDFVTPAFPAFVSGHSIFSRSAAEVLAALTGSTFFPGGLLEVVTPSNFVRIDRLPSAEVHLQWATYFDAADQAGLSRVWGGIHLEPDDLKGRQLGHLVGLDALQKARRYFAGTVR